MNHEEVVVLAGEVPRRLSEGPEEGRKVLSGELGLAKERVDEGEKERVSWVGQKEQHIIILRLHRTQRQDPAGIPKKQIRAAGKQSRGTEGGKWERKGKAHHLGVKHPRNLFRRR